MIHSTGITSYPLHKWDPTLIATYRDLFGVYIYLSSAHEYLVNIFNIKTYGGWYVEWDSQYYLLFQFFSVK